MAVSPENKALAKYLKSVLGGQPAVRRYWDDARKSFIDIASTEDARRPGVTSYATLGLSDYPTSLTVDGVPLGCEFLMAVRSTYSFAPNALATCAFEVINTKMEPRPGALFPRVIELYQPKGDMQHILFVAPFLWELETQSFASKNVAWLLAIAISDKERLFAREESVEALEKVFEERQIDVFDLGRNSVY